MWSSTPRSAGSRNAVLGAVPRFYNSLGRRLVELRPLEPGLVRIYTCGPTVYADAHLGNMRPYVFSDTLRRCLQWKGLAVVQVVNITDVGHAVGDGDLGEDKVEATARREVRPVREVTRHYTERFFADLAALNVLPPTHCPVASEYVPKMIEFAEVLDRKGYTYQLDSGLYFDTSRSPGYGRLAVTPPGGEHDRARVERVPGKRARADFAVWRAERGPQRRLVHWESPWGPGVPGWHLECSVMSIDQLGAHFDVHTGGVDHREIHHVNEIAQSEAFLQDGRDWVPLWLHNEFLLFNNEKIAKSAGRAPLLRDLVDTGYHPLVFRYLLLTATYRQQLDLTDDGIRAAATAYRRLLGRARALGPLPTVGTLAQLRSLVSPAALPHVVAIDEAISEDLNTPRVLAELNAALREDLPVADRAALVAGTDALLGLRLGDLGPAELMAAASPAVSPEYVESLVAEREAARRARDWAGADRIRAELRGLGIRVRDTPDGPHWAPVDAVEA
jgi:cysteinyl-tRNA synthetase